MFPIMEEDTQIHSVRLCESESAVSCFGRSFTDSLRQDGSGLRFCSVSRSAGSLPGFSLLRKTLT